MALADRRSEFESGSETETPAPVIPFEVESWLLRSGKGARLLITIVQAIALASAS